MTATRALRGVWPQRASVPMLPEAILLGRDRNKVKFSKWGFYLKDTHPQVSMQSLRAAASIHKARVPGRTNQPLVLEKISRNKVEVAWPLPVSADTCARFLKLALGDNWRFFVTDPAGVQGGHQEAGTAEEGVVAAEDTKEDTKEDKKDDQKEFKKVDKKDDKKEHKKADRKEDQKEDKTKKTRKHMSSDSDSDPETRSEDTPKRKKRNKGKA